MITGLFYFIGVYLLGVLAFIGLAYIGNRFPKFGMITYCHETRQLMWGSWLLVLLYLIGAIVELMTKIPEIPVSDKVCKWFEPKDN